VDAAKPFSALAGFGGAFLNAFELSECNADALLGLTFIDSPGVLSGEKQRIGRRFHCSAQGVVFNVIAATISPRWCAGSPIVATEL
jgi:hypothetical protein